MDLGDCRLGQDSDVTTLQNQETWSHDTGFKEVRNREPNDHFTMITDILFLVNATMFVEEDEIAR